MKDYKMPRPWFSGKKNARLIGNYIIAHEPAREVRAGERMLGKFIIPDFQRPQVWTEEQQIKLIESLYAGIPIGVFVVNIDTKEPYDFDSLLLDGQQRWTSIINYTNSEFPVHGYLFEELSAGEKRNFMQISVSEIETSLTSYDACLEVYNRLAYGGTAHEGPKPAEIKAFQR
ncbi:DUF262 domain-containing protein [Thalassospira xianhensis]|uniref:GmrSD restriction endonucleases N-terminal domain-containing protein n=2 Tax=Thalassospira TaxID=168934 RepID=A0A285TH35_9PROT|nr:MULTISPECIES: DUF262 domain-containing protein [Thalassospira]RCK07579.1 hypothetical protein TH5_00395 [Thalassospira xianhensis MCCC 1A02616]SOC21459.1 Protein of unknown function DUF262 [Thalassospira xiamenensis]